MLATNAGMLPTSQREQIRDVVAGWQQQCLEELVLVESLSNRDLQRAVTNREIVVVVGDIGRRNDEQRSPPARGASGWSFKVTRAVIIFVRLAIGTGCSRGRLRDDPDPTDRDGRLAVDRPLERGPCTRDDRGRNERRHGGGIGVRPGRPGTRGRQVHSASGRDGRQYRRRHDRRGGADRGRLASRSSCDANVSLVDVPRWSPRAMIAPARGRAVPFFSWRLAWSEGVSCGTSGVRSVDDGGGTLQRASGARHAAL